MNLKIKLYNDICETAQKIIDSRDFKLTKKDLELCNDIIDVVSYRIEQVGKEKK